MTKKNKKPDNNSKKNYYRNLIAQHKSILAKARGLIEVLLDKLEREINSVEVLSAGASEKSSKTTSPSTSTSTSFLFGEKDSASSIVVKLTTILLKLIPLEQEIARADLTKADIMELEELSIKTRIPEEDLEIIERYVERYNESKNQ